MLLNKKVNDENEFIQAMVDEIKGKFDKYWEWGDYNLLMVVAAI